LQITMAGVETKKKRNYIDLTTETVATKRAKAVVVAPVEGSPFLEDKLDDSLLVLHLLAFVDQRDYIRLSWCNRAMLHQFTVVRCDPLMMNLSSDVIPVDQWSHNTMSSNVDELSGVVACDTCPNWGFYSCRDEYAHGKCPIVHDTFLHMPWLQLQHAQVDLASLCAPARLHGSQWWVRGEYSIWQNLTFAASCLIRSMVLVLPPPSMFDNDADQWSCMVSVLSPFFSRLESLAIRGVLRDRYVLARTIVHDRGLCYRPPHLRHLELDNCPRAVSLDVALTNALESFTVYNGHCYPFAHDTIQTVRMRYMTKQMLAMIIDMMPAIETIEVAPLPLSLSLSLSLRHVANGPLWMCVYRSNSCVSVPPTSKIWRRKP
jgi:hypothetical protein